MATSFQSQIETIVNLLIRLRPKMVIDIGKGFGKYGFLLHEYAGISTQKHPDPALTLAQQSDIIVDAVESNSDYLWPHIRQLYRNVMVGRIEDIYRDLHGYDLVLMLDVIEHLDAQPAREIVRHFIRDGSIVIVSSPSRFFQQDLYESADERHVSFWGPREVAGLAPFMDYQRIGPGRIFVLANRPINLFGFGRAPLKRLKRIARRLFDEVSS